MRIKYLFKVLLLGLALIFILFQLAACHSSTTEEQKEFKFQSPDLQKTKKPLKRSSFHLDLGQFESLRLYHALADDRVKYVNPLIKDIANKSFRKDLNKLFGVLNNARIEKHYLSGTPDYNPEQEIKTVFLKFNGNSYNGIYPTLELFLANDGTKFTIREYYYANVANYYAIDIESNRKLIKQLEIMINKYTTFNKAEKTWL